ncbi:MAG: hypothetical protein KC464_21765, partial [Myxococcales bacterium]|nr:hypothetical protein [Myxococcales bacterium]
AITALAASDGRVAIGDADGVLCLRRGDDGALLQCVAAHDHPVAALAVDGERLISRGDDARAWHLPDLARGVGVDRIGVQWAGGEVVVDGAAVDLVADGHRSRVIEMAGPVHGVAVSPDGRLAVAAWITQLDQPSIVLIAPPGPPRPRDRMGR